MQSPLKAFWIKVFWMAAVVLVGLGLAGWNVDSSEAAEVDTHADAAAEHADGEGAHGAGGDPNPLVVDLDLAIWTGVVFLALLFVLNRYAWPTIVIALDEREKRIANQIAAAEAKHEDAKKVLAAHEARLAQAADEVRELLEEARRDAEHTKAQIIAEAKKGAAEERQRAVREVEQAKDSALHELAERSAHTAIDLAGRVVGEQLTPERHAEIVREALGKLAAANPSAN